MPVQHYTSFNTQDKSGFMADLLRRRDLTLQPGLAFVIPWRYIIIKKIYMQRERPLPMVGKWSIQSSILTATILSNVFPVFTSPSRQMRGWCLRLLHCPLHSHNSQFIFSYHRYTWDTEVFLKSNLYKSQLCYHKNYVNNFVVNRWQWLRQPFVRYFFRSAFIADFRM
jgi:hypothetical protein